jgi:hypothetical protein
VARFGRGPGLAAAATALKVTEGQLRTALDGGKTLAQVAKDKSVPVATLISALVKGEQAHIAQAAKDGAARRRRRGPPDTTARARRPPL